MKLYKRQFLIGLSGAALLALGAVGCSESSAPKPAVQYSYDGAPYDTPPYNEQATIDAMRILSADDMQGREAGTQGGAMAAEYILTVNADFMKQYQGGVSEFDRTTDPNNPIKGKNIGLLFMGLQKDMSAPLLVITAHYDHLGVMGDDIYNGADDNASGSAALFAIAQSFHANPPTHNVAIVWLDAEEKGLSGARDFLESTSYFEGAPALNLNLDMIAQNQDGELYMAGAYHMPALGPLMAKAAKGTGVTLKFGHDRPEDGDGDWTLLSDHGVFHQAGFPFVYLGVEDHEHYHKPTDTFETIPLEFYKQSLKTVVNAAHILDDNLSALARPAKSEQITKEKP